MSIKEFFALAFIILGILLNLKLQDAMAEGDGPDWALKQRHNPSSALLAQEARGQVTVFDGLPVDEVDRALDNEFERIDRMMAVRTRRPEPGDPPAGDCD
jgi:hypothetical protein